MGLSFLDKVALNICKSGATRGLTNAVTLLGTGMIVYGVYKLAEKSLGLDEKPHQSTPNSNTYIFNGDGTVDKVIDIPEVDPVGDDIEKDDAVVETAKHIGWVFGGMIVKSCVSSAYKIVIDRLRYLLTLADNRTSALLGTNRRCVDAMKVAARDIRSWSDIVKDDQAQFHRGRAKGISEAATFMEDLMRGANT